MTSIEIQQYLEVDGLRQLTRQQLGSLVNPLTSASARRGRPNRSDGLLKLYGITRADLVAAQRRRQRGIQPHDGRRILLAHERVALTNWLETCSEKRACKSRGMIVEVVCELLEIRRSAREDALNTNSELLDRIPTLSSAELALLARHQEAESSDNPMSQARLSNDWFRGLESDSNIYLTTAVTQNPARVTAATAEACTRHFSSLDELLADLDFVHRSGRHAGMIKTNCITRLERAVRHMKNQPSHVEPEDTAVTPPQSPASAPSGSSTPRSNTTPQPLVWVWDANWSLDEGRAHFDRLAASFSRLEERHQDMIRSTPRQRRLLDRITPQERSRRRRASIFGPMSSGPSAADLEGRERRRVHLHASRERRATRVANEADLRAALNVQRITIANLKSFCRSHCLGTTGSRAELRTHKDTTRSPTAPSHSLIARQASWGGIRAFGNLFGAD
ncbi:uncharacterized protein MONBRDRAFT_4757 [Monosiga brevicollis MX1]|uniref:SAP domain-containing protein n=1 Tax=Monosiga brevicollis TaxID=81824 RepID=A9UNU9_MONBE|nr:uncharacterized protein MONBRDRAFT_4757 [Monosiga brevicollis MX1]EDQ92764.1 predicted protein [Monosiga brevicollis MX1]|eukprot:XP_001742526.1 hypothetical protein [Monosiga brevicollis MX1]